MRAIEVAHGITAIKEALAQPEQEPVVWISNKDFEPIRQRIMEEAALAQPPQRTWVGLTDDEVYKIAFALEGEHWKKIADAIEAKLKEKNT
jgi:hypothetical protein